ncbi:MAG: LUD domain-containing protein, partial [Gammaproteobacteria bacterium]|nr:LUD domain-containing protein [Gammaproteobacteria bacterium]
TANLPKIHIVVTSIEKVIPDMQALGGFLRLLGRSATGQIMSVYTTLFNGPKRIDDLDGPEEFHVVLVDNGRSEILGTQFQDILRCIKCGACMNHCPVYTNIGGHAYGWVYPGPMGSVLTPLMVGQKNAPDLPYACTLNGRCKTVCPVMIPLPDLLRKHRNNLVEMGESKRFQRWGMWVWAQVARNPRLYFLMTSLYVRKLNVLARLLLVFRRGSFKHIPMLGAWTSTRDFPVPSTATFQGQWKKRKRSE